MSTLYQQVRAALRESDFKPKKKLGQNFLVHERVIASILRLLELSSEDEIVEIGPGFGFLTHRLVEVASKVWAVEVDRLLVERLRKSPLGSHPAFQLIHDDVLRLEFSQILPARKVKLVGNLPYSISTPVLFRLFELREHFSVLVLMLQREVADRLASAPARKSYGTLSVWCQIHGQIIGKVSVSPEAFFPRPKVRSTILKIALYPEPLIPKEDIPLLRNIVRSAFGQRRKTLGNALSGLLRKGRAETEAILEKAGIQARRRGETLSVEEFIRLARVLRSVLITER